jgi:exosortase
MIATDAGRSILRSPADEPHTPWYARLLKPEVWAVCITALVLGLAYAPNLLDLYTMWTNDENYSHGFLIIPISLVIFWRRPFVTEPAQASRTFFPSWWGWVLLGAVLVVRALAYEWSLQWVETATIVPAVACLVWTLGGWPLLRRAWPAIAFLLFMLPLPRSINGLVALPLQGIAATGSCFLLQLSRLWAIQNGNIISLGTPHGVETLDVALACSGLRMLMTLAATVTATIILIPLPNWKRIVLLVSAVPIAIISNMIRIVATGWCYYLVEGSRGKQLAHDWAGYLMMILALVLVGLELGILSWLVPEDNESSGDDRKSMLPMLTERKK